MEFRRVEIEELDQIARLFDDYRVFYEQESDFEGSKEFLKERILNAESVIYICRLPNGELVGFVQLYPIFSSTRMKKLWLLNDLFVNPDSRGKGISIKLIDCAKALTRETNAAGLILETAKSNVVGNKLYPKTGFTLDQDHNFYSWEE